MKYFKTVRILWKTLIPSPQIIYNLGSEYIQNWIAKVLCSPTTV